MRRNGPVFNPWFEILMGGFLFHYTFGGAYCQDLFLFWATNGFCNAKFRNLRACGSGYKFLKEADPYTISRCHTVRYCHSRHCQPILLDCVSATAIFFLLLILSLCLSVCLLCMFMGLVGLPSARQHPSYCDCLEVKREYYQNCYVLGCVTQCSQSAAHSCEQFLQVQQIRFVTLGPLHHAWRRLPRVVLL